MEEWEKAKLDLTVAKAMGVDIVTEFRNDYESIPDFERKHGSEVTGGHRRNADATGGINFYFLFEVLPVLNTV